MVCLAARGKRRPFLPIRIPGKAGKAYRAGVNLNLSTADQGTRTWGEFLAERFASPSAQPTEGWGRPCAPSPASSPRELTLCRA